ncbi:putative helicase mug81 [Eutrema salsugineum]|uniref:putative helicase mug81 n=1 Tax=Eutrema salsugineum TaxID=72664 RepID=UPI000CED7621|nr:putative helicase mug81 [Eutrema salsugineum]
MNGRSLLLVHLTPKESSSRKSVFRLSSLTLLSVSVPEFSLLSSSSPVLPDISGAISLPQLVPSSLPDFSLVAGTKWYVIQACVVVYMILAGEVISILQMCGRAGRPPFDDTGMVIIMTRRETVHLYENLLNGCEVVESQLLPCLIEHLTAEIVQLTVNK